MKSYLALSLLYIATSLCSQAFAQATGCTDMQATNYNAAATINDGSCSYPTTTYTPTLQCTLVDSLAESSGLLADGAYIWTHNDGGNAPMLFQINKTDGSIHRKVYISNASNIDWEAMTQNETHIFIGDIGNNDGNRTDLRILKIAKSAIAISDTVAAAFIHFSYPEQTDVTTAPFLTSYDCEAMIYANDSLYLFTKDWITENTQMYALPSTTGTYAARLHTSFAANGLITDAAYDAELKTVVLLGYKKNSLGIFVPFSWLMFDFENYSFFKGNKRRIGLGNVMALGQNEGIVLMADYKGYISGEAIVQESVGISEPAKLSYFDFKEYVTNGSAGIPSYIKPQLKVYPNPAQIVLYIDNLSNPAHSYSIFDINGKVMKSGMIQNQQIAINELATGVYLLEIAGKGSIPFVKN